MALADNLRRAIKLMDAGFGGRTPAFNSGSGWVRKARELIHRALSIDGEVVELPEAVEQAGLPGLRGCLEDLSSHLGIAENYCHLRFRVGPQGWDDVSATDPGKDLWRRLSGPRLDDEALDRVAGLLKRVRPDGLCARLLETLTRECEQIELAIAPEERQVDCEKVAFLGLVLDAPRRAARRVSRADFGNNPQLWKVFAALHEAGPEGLSRKQLITKAWGRTKVGDTTAYKAVNRLKKLLAATTLGVTVKNDEKKKRYCLILTWEQCK